MWYREVSSDINKLSDFIDYYSEQLTDAKKEVKIYGSVERNASELPGISEFRFNQLQEIEAILNMMNINLRKIRSQHFQKYLEKYQKALSSRDAEKYVDNENEVVDYELLINEVALIRNKYLGVIKGLEQKSFMLGHIVKLRCAGMEDVSL